MIYAKVEDGHLVLSHTQWDSSFTAFNVPDTTWLYVSGSSVSAYSTSQYIQNIALPQALSQLAYEASQTIYSVYPSYKQNTDMLHMQMYEAELASYTISAQAFKQQIMQMVASIYSSTNPPSSYTQQLSSLTSSYTMLSSSMLQDSLNIGCRLAFVQNIINQYKSFSSQLVSSSTLPLPSYTFQGVWLP